MLKLKIFLEYDMNKREEGKAYSRKRYLQFILLTKSQYKNIKRIPTISYEKKTNKNWLNFLNKYFLEKKILNGQ